MTEELTDEQLNKRAKCAVKLAIEKKRVLEVPIYTYDRATKTICQITKDGQKQPICRRYCHGRYSERVSKET